MVVHIYIYIYIHKNSHTVHIIEFNKASWNTVLITIVDTFLIKK